MSTELLQNEELHTESMADYEAHFDDANPWNRVQSYMDNGTNLSIKIEGIVNGGAIAMVEGLRGFIPASRLSLSYVEDLETEYNIKIYRLLKVNKYYRKWFKEMRGEWGIYLWSEYIHK